MNDQSDDAALARWDAYWQHGFLTSCADAFDGNYGGAIAHYWQSVFAQQPDGAVVLDVCTGNGAVAALAARHALARSIQFRVLGVDLARIEPARALADQPQLLEQIEFFPRTSAAATPFDDQSIDLVCGQYALEYTPLDETLHELARVLRPGGAAHFIIHHNESVILRTTAAELAHRPLLSGDDTLLDAAAALAEVVATATTPSARQALATDPTAEACRRRLNELAAQMSRRAQESAHPEILYVALNYAKKGYSTTLSAGLDAGRALLARGRAEIEANFARLDDLAAAAMDQADMASLNAKLSEQGFDAASPSPFYDDKSLIGWTLEVQRSAIR